MSSNSSSFEAPNYRSTLNDNGKSQINHRITRFFVPPDHKEEDTFEHIPSYNLGPGEEEVVATNWDLARRGSAASSASSDYYEHEEETKAVVKEDIEFFLALLGGQEPPPATEQTQHFIQEEMETKRKSEEVLEREVSERRKKEKIFNKSDVGFWNMIMKAF